MKKLIINFILILLSTHFAFPQEVTGTWYGMADFSGTLLRLTIHVTGNNLGYSATLDSPDQEAFGLQTDTVIITGNEFLLKYKQQNFSGIISKDIQAITGKWNFGDQSIDLNLGRKPIDPPNGSIMEIKNRYDKKELYITMRDGIRLFTSIYTPKDNSEKHPILMVRTPYNIEPREKAYNSRLLFMNHLLEDNYIIVFQDVRGRYMSEGTFLNIRPFLPNKKEMEVDDNSDTYDTIEWLINNIENNNGNVGIFGVSYPGFYSTLALPGAHPALKAVSPQAPISDWFIGDDAHHNGAFFLMDSFFFIAQYFRERPEPTRKFNKPFQFQNEDNYDFFMDLGPVKNAELKYFGDTIPSWSDLIEHPNYDEFWKKRSPLPHLKNIEPAVLVVGGWFDAEDLYGPLKTYASIEKLNASGNNNLLVMGPWSHGQWTSPESLHLGNIHFGSNTSDYFKDIELKFFNYYLKGKGEMDLPEASIFITGSNQWQEFDTWPPKNIEKKKLFLHQDEHLSFEAPTHSESFDEYISDPDKPVPYTEDVHMWRTTEYLTDDQRFASRRPDVMVYQSTILEEDITLAGPINVDLFVSTTGTDADYVVKIIDVFPDKIEYPKNDKNVPMGGYQMLVRGEVFRGKYRNSFEKPEPIKPNEVTKISFEIPDLAHTFQKGHKLMIQIQNSWFPLVDRNPQQFLNIYACDEDDFIKATHKIFHDKMRPSNISVNVLK